MENTIHAGRNASPSLTCWWAVKTETLWHRSGGMASQRRKTGGHVSRTRASYSITIKARCVLLRTMSASLQSLERSGVTVLELWYPVEDSFASWLMFAFLGARTTACTLWCLCTLRFKNSAEGLALTIWHLSFGTKFPTRPTKLKTVPASLASPTNPTLSSRTIASLS